MIALIISSFSGILSHLTVLAGIIIILVIYKSSLDDLERIWKFSKILTLKELIKKNNFETYPILNFDSNGNKSLYKYNYHTLLANSGKECKKGYKKCGILDTMGNIMCIPEEDICPINEVIIDLESNKISYTLQGYNYTYFENLTEGYVLYYKNNEINNSIITDIKYSLEIPTYINKDNFVLDQSEYNKYERRFEEYDDYDYHMTNKSFLSGRKKYKKRNALRKLELNINDSTVNDYLIEKMKGDWNIDKSYQKINMNMYKSNYIGFQDSSNMQQYNDLDLYEFYSIDFPNDAAFVFCIVILVFFIVSMGLLHLPVSIGYLCYTLHENKKIYRTIDIIMNIKADPFLQNYLTELKERKPSHNYNIALIALFSSTLGLSILFVVFLCVGLGCEETNSDKMEDKSNEEKKENLV